MKQKRLLLLLLVLLLIQLAGVSGRFGQPFLDGRNHWHYDCAAFLLRAVHSLAPDLHSPLDVFGLTEYAYDDANVPVMAGYYSHHGVVLPVILRCGVALFGPTEGTINAMMLALSLLSTVLVFRIVQRATQREVLTFCITLLYILLPLKFLYCDKVKYEVVVEVFLLLCVDQLGRIPSSRRARGFFLAAYGLTFLTDFYAFLPAALIWLVVWFRRSADGMKRLPLHTMLAGGLGMATTLVLQYLLGFHPGEAAGIAGFRMSLDESSVTIADYVTRQAAFLAGNLGEAPLTASLMALLVILMTCRRGYSAAGAMGLVFVGGGLGWLIIMRNHSYIHHYAQWMFVTACPLLLAGAAAVLRETDPAPGSPAAPPRAAPLLLAALLPVILLAALDTRRSLADFHASDLGTPEDILTLRALDKRLVVLPDGPSGPLEWWFSPVIRLYTDPVFRNSPRVGVERIDQIELLDPANDLVVLLNDPESWTGMNEWCAAEYGIGKLTPVQVSPTFAYFRFELVEPPPAGEYAPDDGAIE